MPSHTPASALIKLYFIGGAPWKWDAWKDLTNIRHGLFPDDDHHLPPGISRQDIVDIQSYFNAYQEQKSEDDKVIFATNSRGAAAYPGRKTWNAFVSKNWNRWRIHTIIVDELKDWNIHPYDIVLRENLGSSWPASDNFVPVILDTLGLRLFGEDGFVEGTNVLRSDLRVLLKIFVQRSWCRIRNHISKVKIRAITAEGAARQAFKDLEDGKPTNTNVNRAIRTVAKWKECAEILNTPQSIKTAEEMIDDLKEIMETLGAKVSAKKVANSKGPLKVSKQALKTLASEEDVTDLLNAYHEYFESNPDEDDELPISDSLSAETQGRLIDDPDVGDFGMEVEGTMDPKQLAKALGFKNHLPFSFNSYRHKFGTLPWDDESLFKFPTDQPLPQFIDFLKLHWHQLAGIHSIVRSIFLENPDEFHPTGVLIGDEVGLGKTAQSIAFIAFLNQVVYVQNKNLPPPPILAARSYLGGSQSIPSLPHLILCPGTIAAQWISELKTLFMPWSIDIFLYDSRTDSSSFWGPEGPLRTSKHEAHNRVVVATHSVVFSEFKKLHNNPPSKNSRPWTMPPVASKKTTVDTIFGQNFLTIIVDEAHHMRNPGNKHLAMLRVLQQAKVRLVMTATPLHTAPKDIASLCRLVGIQHFSDEASYLEEKDDAALLRRAKKVDDDGATLIREQLKIVRRLQKHCIGHFLRRTTVSLNWEGNVLLPLPQPKEIIGLIGLTEREEAIIAERAKGAKDAIESSSKRIQTKKFYLEYRLAVAYAKEDASQLIPRFKSLEEWEPLKSTKMDACARICAHYLTHDHVDDIRFEEGQLIFPDILQIQGVKLPRMRRIIIYSEFPSMAPLLQNILQLYGVESLVINGEIPFHHRDKRVKDLYDDKHPARVLIFSAVASVGLNLAIADVVIFFDQPWSAQDERQVRGRAHRQPQKKVVRVIHLLAINSADTVMYSVARGKENMFDAFVNKDLADELRNLLQGGLPDDPEDNPVMDDETSSEQKGKSKKARRRGKPLIAEGGRRKASAKDGDGLNSEINASDSDDEKLLPQQPKQTKPRRRPKHKDGNEISSVKDGEGGLSISNRVGVLSMPDGDGPQKLTGREDDVSMSVGDDILAVSDGDGMLGMSDGDGLSSGYHEVPPISDAEGMSEGDRLSAAYLDSNSEADATGFLSRPTAGNDSDCDDRSAKANDIPMRSLSPPSPPSQPRIKRARHGSLDEETRSNIKGGESPIQSPVPHFEDRTDVASRGSSGKGTTTKQPTGSINAAGSSSANHAKAKPNPFAATNPRPAPRSISNPVPSGASVARYNYTPPCPKHPGLHIKPAPTTSHSQQTQPALTHSHQPSQPSQRSRLSTMQARARQHSFMDPSAIESVSRPGSPQQQSSSAADSLARLRRLPSATQTPRCREAPAAESSSIARSRQHITQPSFIRPVSRSGSPQQRSDSSRNVARLQSLPRQPSVTQTSQHHEAPVEESPSITRPRQPGSMGVPPKNALKYTRKKH